MGYLAIPNRFVFFFVCGNVHGACDDFRGRLAQLAAFLIPAVAYGIVFLLAGKLIGVVSRAGPMRED
jgi:hypothetical protein